MRDLNLAEGSLILLGAILVINAVAIKFTDINVLDPITSGAGNFLIVACTCFFLAIISMIFDHPGHRFHKAMNLAEGAFIFLGLMIILNAVIIKFTGFNMLDPTLKSATDFLLVANACFSLAFISVIFDRAR